MWISLNKHHSKGYRSANYKVLTCTVAVTCNQPMNNETKLLYDVVLFL